ncbi:uncharacterized protein LOC122037117 isoform X1 [Zingiber officinale]|uniref:Uncharacterized protein n=1 Tax=Zingiber officinale TaxID=94328 RepID=A0A8J5BU78_ZINOF|nr:uncharacterized protein LOC122037117 isoform X1 [Zingiber officinale]KAG6467106.1 hypothetical protein ZIOFF_075079 [Zingiber officinale]
MTMENQVVVAIDCIAGGSKAKEWSGGDSEAAALQTGDILEEVIFRALPPARAPFKGGRAAVMKQLHTAYKRGDTSVLLKARRGWPDDPSAATIELQACITSNPQAGRRQYVLRSIQYPNHAVGIVDRSLSDCFALLGNTYPFPRRHHRSFPNRFSCLTTSAKGSRNSRAVSALSNFQLQDGYVSYPWEKMMRNSLDTPNSSGFFSLLILPKAVDPSGTRYNSVEDTLARANAWLDCSQASGVPIACTSVQTEALLTKISGETASSTVNTGSLADLSNLANVSLYGFEDYHGVDIGVIRAVRLWYTPKAGEMAVEIRLREGDSKLGFAISRTEEGFVYISSVIDDDSPNIAATRSGLRELFREATEVSKLLVVSRVGGEKVLPWMVSTSGAIRCFDTVSLSQKLSLHRHALKPILLHLFMWEREMVPPRPAKMAEKPEDKRLPSPHVGRVLDDLVYRGGPDGSLTRDTAGDLSFRFHNFSITRNWV